MTNVAPNEPDANVPDPGPLMQLSTAYWGSQTLLTANRIGLFALLADGPLTAEATAERLGTRPRPTELLLRACVALGLLRKQGSGYTDSELARAFLVPGSPGYLGNAIRYSDNLYATWGELEQSLREGGPRLAAEQYTGDDPDRTRHFVYGMHDRALGVGRVLAQLVDLQGRCRLLDVGGGPGTYSALFALQNPQLRSQVMDLPGVTAIANEIIEKMGVADRVTTLAGDYLKDEFPVGNDIVLISGVFHRETEADCRGLIRRAHDSLEQGGLLVVSDVLTDATGTAPPFATLFGLNMMLTAPHGGVHSAEAVASWMREADFVDVGQRAFPPPMPHRVITGVRP